jgi:hypothetical protein
MNLEASRPTTLFRIERERLVGRGRVPTPWTGA